MSKRTNPEPITFRRNGAIMRGIIRVGWIEDRRDICGEWYVRLTPASGKPGLVGYADKLADAKIKAREALQHACPGSDTPTARPGDAPQAAGGVSGGGGTRTP